jgi:GGDEF domain-containing protein
VVATTLYKNLPEADFVGHWAQNRFVAIVVDCPAVALARVGDMLRRVVSVAAIPWWGDLLSVTISVGGSAAREDDTVDSLLARAEQALQSCLLKGGGGPEII